MNDERTLLLAMHRGSDRAGRALWSRHAAGLARLARAIARDEVLADDLVQQAFCAVLALDRSTVRSIRDPRAYLAMAVRNAAHLHARSDARRRARERSASETTIKPSATDHASREGLWNTIGRLPIEMREAIVLRHQLGLSFDQMAAVLDEPRATVASRYRRAIDRLRTMLAEKDDKRLAQHPLAIAEGDSA